VVIWLGELTELLAQALPMVRALDKYLAASLLVYNSLTTVRMALFLLYQLLPSTATFTP
jgi:hypothetical protein